MAGRQDDRSWSAPWLQLSEAVAINGRGQVVGWTVIRVEDVGGFSLVRHAFVWENGKMRRLGGKWGSEAVAINERGQVVGSGTVKVGGYFATHAFLWENGQTRDLGTLGGSLTEAVGVNERGQIIGWAETKADNAHAFLWENGKMRDLGTLPKNDESRAVALNNSNQIIGQATAQHIRVTGVLWTFRSG